MALFKKQQQPKPRGNRTYNRTPVTTYYRSKDEPGGRSPFKRREAKKDRRKYLFGAADVLLIFFLLAALVYSLILNSRPKVEATDTSYHSAAEYNSKLAADFGGLQNRNKITFDEQGVINSIQKQFPEVQTALIELPFFSEQPKVRLIISPPAFKLASGGQVYIVDFQGLAVGLAKNSPAEAKLVTVNDQSGFQAAAGKQVLSSQEAGFISSVIQQSQRAKVPLSSLSLPAVPQELDLRTTDQPYFIKFYLDGDANTQAGQFLAARQKFAQSHITPSQYLDVRVQGKIFYK
jgi:hypothetical protein